MIEMCKVRQIFEPSLPLDVERQLREDIASQGFLNDLRPGSTVGIAVGSRGIAQIRDIVEALAAISREYQVFPSVFAAMGSHGSNEDGQLDILRGLGISEDIGIPVIACSKCQCIGHINGIPVYINRVAQDFDYIIVVNRVKPHTSFTGLIESGLTKMLAVGVGGHKGAEIVHSRGSEAIPELIEQIGKAMIERLPIIMGIAVVEDKSHNIKTMHVCAKEDFLEVDKVLLQEARRLLPILPFEEIDVLIVNQMGKCFSGTGMDTNVIGRVGIRGVPDRGLKVEYIVVLDLADESYGNANGIGLADITTEKLVKKIDYSKTLKNVLTTSFIDRAKIPVTLCNDKEAVEIAIGLTAKSSNEIRIVHIPNTLEIEEFYVSKALADNQCLEILQQALIMNFDNLGNITRYIPICGH